MRALPWRTVLETERVLPYGGDALYHLRRIVYSATRFPESLEFDRYLQFPHGAKPIWTPLFDWSVAALLQPLASPADPTRLERAAMWVPPLLGAAAVAALFCVARRNFGTSVAWLAAGMLTLLSGHFWYSQIGFLDHHAAVALCAVLLLGAGMRFVRDPRPGAAVGLGAAMALALLVWPGSLLHVALVQAGCGLEVVRRGPGCAARQGARWLGLAHAVAFAALLPFAAFARWPQWSAFSPVVLGAFQLWWLGLGAGWALACAWLWCGERGGGTTWRRARAAFIAALGLLAVSLAAFPGLLVGASDAWRWLARREAFQVLVGESQPLLWEARRFSLDVAVARLSGFALLVPLAWSLALRAARGPRSGPLRLFLLWSIGLCVVTLLQRRFFNSFSIATSLLFGWSCVHAWRTWGLATAPARTRRLAGLGFGLGIAVLLAPTLATYRMPLGNQWRTAQGAPLQVSARRMHQRILLETSDWLRRNTPETAGWLEPERRPEYGILAPWSAGHAIQYAARRPTLVDGFGDDLGPEGFALAERYYRSPPAIALALGERLGIRYVVVQERFDFGAPAPGPESIHRALHQRDGSTGAQPSLPALTRHRLVYESASPRRDDPTPLYKVFEVVPGARIRGRAAPDADVTLELTLHTNRDREIAYRAVSHADSRGHYEFRVPYANWGSAPAVRVGAEYRLQSGDHTGEVVVTEAQLMEDAEVAGPDLRGPDARRGAGGLL